MTCTLMLPSFGTCAHVAQQHLLTCSPAKCILCYRCAAAVRKTFIALRKVYPGEMLLCWTVLRTGCSIA